VRARGGVLRGRSVAAGTPHGRGDEVVPNSPASRRQALEGAAAFPAWLYRYAAPALLRQRGGLRCSAPLKRWREKRPGGVVCAQRRGDRWSRHHCRGRVAGFLITGAHRPRIALDGRGEVLQQLIVPGICGVGGAPVFSGRCRGRGSYLGREVGLILNEPMIASLMGRRTSNAAGIQQKTTSRRRPGDPAIGWMGRGSQARQQRMNTPERGSRTVLFENTLH